LIILTVKQPDTSVTITRIRKPWLIRLRFLIYILIHRFHILLRKD
jgi:hypothetical protein